MSGKLGKNETKRLQAQALKDFMSETDEEERVAFLHKGVPDRCARRPSDVWDC